MNPLVGIWVWACETRLIFVPPALVVGGLIWQGARAALHRWADRQPPPAWNWRDYLDPAEADALELDIADGFDRLYLHLGEPPVIDTRRAPEDETSRWLDDLYYADAHQTRKETEQ